MNKTKKKIQHMTGIISVFVVALLFILPYMASAIEYQYKKIEEFKTLESFKSIEEFESSYKKYTQHCLDNTGGGTGGIPCFVSYELWDRELNIYFNKLMKALGAKEKKLLRDSQTAYIKEREETINFNSAILDKKYMQQQGTMYALMRAGDADDMITPAVKERVLLLKKWLEFLRSTNKKRQEK